MCDLLMFVLWSLGSGVLGLWVLDLGALDLVAPDLVVGIPLPLAIGNLIASIKTLSGISTGSGNSRGLFQ